jgi:benzodiazapine receptor
VSKSVVAWFVSAGICLAAGAVGSVFTASSVKTWYPGLIKPAGTPPAWVFAPVWTTLYLLMATAAWLVWRQRANDEASTALLLFCIQLALNAAWSAVFFGLRQPGPAMVEILVLLVAASVTTIRFGIISPPAFWLMLPYIAWIAYATFLNFGIWRLNRGAA